MPDDEVSLKLRCLGLKSFVKLPQHREVTAVGSNDLSVGTDTCLCALASLGLSHDPACMSLRRGWTVGDLVDCESLTVPGFPRQ